MVVIDEKSRFICDVMLGRLARWLRIFGYDTLYWNECDDYKLLRIAIQENRMLLTRDTRLMKIAGPRRALFLESEKLRPQLQQILNDLEIESNRVLSICPVCNGAIEKINHKREIQNKVPAYTYKTHHEFYRCCNCAKIYWHGSHSSLAEEFLKGLNED